jgi:hypothetical protein
MNRILLANELVKLAREFVSTNEKKKLKRLPRPKLIPASSADRAKAKRGEAHEVVFPVSYEYNGGITIDGKWHNGYQVPRPVVPAGWRLIGIGVGLQLNAQPPFATMRLEPTK